MHNLDVEFCQYTTTNKFLVAIKELQIRGQRTIEYFFDRQEISHSTPTHYIVNGLSDFKRLGILAELL